ncbi:MAG: HEAT repeat domain-containing protein [Chloroflexia bacterium]
MDEGARRASEVLRQLREEDPWFSYPDAVEMLSMLEEAEVPELAAGLGEGSAKLRAAVARALGAYRTAEARAAVENVLTDPSPDVRRAAVAALGEWGDPGAVAGLARVVSEDPDRYTRLAAVQVLAASGDPAAATLLAVFLAAATLDDVPVLGEAVDALAGFGSTVALRPLLALLGNAEPALQEKALAGLAALGDPAAALPLREYAAREEDAYLAGLAERVAGRLNG